MFVISLGFGVIGFVDDYIKVVKKRNLGLTAPQKFIMQVVLAAIYIGIDLFQMLIEYFLDYYKYTFAQEYNLHLNQV